MGSIKRRPRAQKKGQIQRSKEKERPKASLKAIPGGLHKSLMVLCLCCLFDDEG
jgi:hypothetical protein